MFGFDHATGSSKNLRGEVATKNIGRSRRDNWTERETQERRELPDLEYFLERTRTHCTLYDCCIGRNRIFQINVPNFDQLNLRSNTRTLITAVPTYCFLRYRNPAGREKSSPREERFESTRVWRLTRGGKEGKKSEGRTTESGGAT